MPTSSFFRFGLLFCLAVAGPVAATQAQTTTLIQGFNNTDLSSYPAGSFAGNASVQGSSYGVSPTEGTGQGLLTTFNSAEIPSNLSGTSGAISASSLESFLGLAANTLTSRGAVEGSAFRSQSLTLGVGDVVSFNFLFLTSEDNTISGYHNDFSFITANGQYLGSNPLANAAGANNGSNTTNFDFQTGATYGTRSITVTTAGNYVFGLGVVDVTDSTIQSGLLIDNLTVTTVPEPGSLWLVAAGGLGGLLLYRRRKRHIA